MKLEDVGFLLINMKLAQNHLMALHVESESNNGSFNILGVLIWKTDVSCVGSYLNLETTCFFSVHTLLKCGKLSLEFQVSLILLSNGNLFCSGFLRLLLLLRSLRLFSIFGMDLSISFGKNEMLVTIMVLQNPIPLYLEKSSDWLKTSRQLCIVVDLILVEVWWRFGLC